MRDKDASQVAERWRERWYGSEPQKGSAITDELGNLIAYFGGDETAHAEVTKIVSAHNATLSAAPKQAEQQGVEALRSALEEAVGVLERLPYGDWPGKMYSGKTVAANALIRRARRALNAPTGAVEKERG
ncbi:MAG: hypothetical protein PGN16_03970 [Sphingomonas phyllosphaerae]|uniref:hypothetical protein n=1 Tax=Sphingomonas phyllosphaerae TaxID=257003 RepID=UPI002FF7BA3C